MTLAEMTHLTAPRGPKMARVGEEVEKVSYDGLQAQRSPPLGERPGCLSDPGPQRSDCTLRHSAGKSPLLVVPALRGDDGTTVRFLFVQNLSQKKKQEEERENKCQREAARCLRCLVSAAHPSSRLASWHSSRRRGRGRRGRGRSRNPSPHVPLVACGYGDVGLWLCDVPVIMQLLFQQSKVCVNMTVSQIQFIGRVLDNPVTSQRQVRTVLTCADYWRLHRCSAWERLLTHPLWCNDPSRVVQTVLVDNGNRKFMAGFASYSHLLLCSFHLSARP